MDPNSTLTVYKTMIPHFDYGDYIWFDSTVENMNQFQLLQNKALRTVYKIKLGPNPALNTDQLHTKAKCHKLRKRCDMHTLFFAFTLKANPNLVDRRNIPTRHQLGSRLIFQPVKNLVYSNGYIHRAILYWNHLRINYVNIDDIETFKCIIKQDFPNCFDVDIYIVYD